MGWIYIYSYESAKVVGGFVNFFGTLLKSENRGRETERDRQRQRERDRETESQTEREREMVKNIMLENNVMVTVIG